VQGFWPVDELAELADGPTGCGEVARGTYLFAWNFSVTRSTVLTEGTEGLDQHDATAELVTRS
jgi:hypothetical protein